MTKSCQRGAGGWIGFVKEGNPVGIPTENARCHQPATQPRKVNADAGSGARAISPRRTGLLLDGVGRYGENWRSRDREGVPNNWCALGKRLATAALGDMSTLHAQPVWRINLEDVL